MSHNNKTYERTNGNFIEQYSIKRIKEKITCDTCNHYIPVNKITNSVECSLCGSENKLNLDFWNRAINRGSFEKLKCKKCNTKYDINDMLYAIENNTALTCKQCGLSLKHRKLPANSISKNNFKITSVFNELNSRIKNKDTNIAMEVECNNCGAPLKVKDNSKFVTCDFCGTENAISQVTLQHINPLKVHPFYILIFNKKWDPVEKEKQEEEKREQEQNKKEKKARIKKLNKLIQNEEYKIKNLKLKKKELQPNENDKPDNVTGVFIIIVISIFLIMGLVTIFGPSGVDYIETTVIRYFVAFILSSILIIGLFILFLIIIGGKDEDKELENKIKIIDKKISETLEKINQYNKEKSLIKNN